MARVSPILTNFTAGEFPERLDGRVDIDRYQNAAAALRNQMVRPQGGAAKTPGTRLVGFARYGDRSARLIDFNHRGRIYYQFELGDSYVRFWRNRAQVVAPETTAAIVNGGFSSGIGSWTSNLSGTGALSWASGSGRMNIAAGDGHAEARQAVSCPANVVHVVRFQSFVAALQVKVGTSAGGEQLMELQTRWPGWHTIAFTTTGTTFHLSFRNAVAGTTAQIDDVEVLSNVPVELATPWPIDLVANLLRDVDGNREVTQLQYSRANDVTFFTAGGPIPPYELSRYGDAAWALERTEFVDGPYLEENLDDDQILTMGGETGSVSASVVKPLFVATDVGRHLRWKMEGRWGWGVITAVASATQATVQVKKTTLSTDTTAEFRLGAWSDTTGYPQACAFFGQRFYLAATTRQQQTVWGSRTGNFRNMAPTRRDEDDYNGNGDLDPVDIVTDADAVAYTLAADTASSIWWLASGSSLLAGTPGGVFRIDGGAPKEGPTPTKVNAARDVTRGSARAKAIVADRSVLYPSKTGRRLLDAEYQIQNDGYDATDATILHDRVLQGGLLDLTYQEEPFACVWAVTDQGNVITFTYDKKQRVLAPTRQLFPLDGKDGEAGAGFVESVSAISNGLQSEIWLLVRRVLNGVTVRCIEVVENEFDELDPDQLPFFVRCGLSFSAWNTDATRSLTLSGGGGWGDGAAKTLSSSGFAPFGSGDVGKWYRLRLRKLRPVRDRNAGAPYYEWVDARITAYTNSSTVSVVLAGACPAGLQGVATIHFARLITEIAGADHLNGLTVQLMADNARCPDVVMSGGAAQLPQPSAEVAVGLGYLGYGETLRLEAGSQDGTAQGKQGRLHGLILRVLGSAGGKAGRPDKLSPIQWRSSRDAMGRALPFQSTDVKIDVAGDWDAAVRVAWESEDPLPFVVSAVLPRLNVTDATAGGRPK